MITGSTPWSITIDVEGCFVVARGEWTLEPKFYLDHFERDGAREYSLEKIREYKHHLFRETTERGWVVELDRT